VWRCESCRDIRVVGGEKDLSEGSGYVAGMDFHRPWIDLVTFLCAKCGATMRRVPDILDVWIDAGVCAWAQLVREPGELERWWPADWITEAGDQTRGWFNAQLATGAIAFDSSPFEAVLLHGGGQELSRIPFWVKEPGTRPSIATAPGDSTRPPASIATTVPPVTISVTFLRAGPCAPKTEPKASRSTQTR